jgi:TRAP-type C4-dicarboxylate transport system permease small subunit
MRIKKVILNFDLVLAAAALVLLCGTTMLQVILRSIFDAPLMGAEEMIPYLLTWVILTPLGNTEWTNGHIIMEEFQVLFPPPIKKMVRFIIALCTTGIYIVVSLSVIHVYINNLNNMTATLKMPFAVFFLPSAIGFIGISLVRITNHICTLLKKEPPWASE